MLGNTIMKTNRIAWICLSLLLLLPFTALAAAPSVVETPSAGLVSWWTGNGNGTGVMIRIPLSAE